MSSTVDGAAGVLDRPTPSRRAGPRLDRVAIGVLVAAGGTGWLLDVAGFAVPWRMFPAGALVVVGLALVATVRIGHGRVQLVAVGVALLAVALAVGLDIGRYAGPIGERVVAPVSGALPGETRIGAGSVTVDLTRGELPTPGHPQVQVGMGTVVVLLPPGAGVRVEAGVVMGSITVDGARDGDGMDVRWSEPAGTATDTVLSVQVGMGKIEVHHG